MADSISLRVHFIDETLAAFDRQGIELPWPEDELLPISSYDLEGHQGLLNIEDLAFCIEQRVERAYTLQTRGQDSAKVRVLAIRKRGDQQILDWEQPANQLLQNGDSISVECNAMTRSNFQKGKGKGTKGKGKGKNPEDILKMIRKKLRFDLNDRVLCNCGSRWLCGHIVGTAVPNEGGLLPYLVKTDPLPGLPSGTISVPGDDDECCIQEVCFNLEKLHLVKAVAPIMASATRPKLRFRLGDSVVCRVRNDAADGLERWVDGTVNAEWPELPGSRQWELNGMCGEYPAVVAYQINLTLGGWVYCHKDHHTLIRRKGWAPQQRVKGISARMEVRKLEDGGKEKVDHQTERCKPFLEDDSEDTDE
mmetsp:Transcript_69900/g.138368  ORF Transcript_69900/g.138368 Transcript_69900/m.138368 type:complete len:364 (-) Transcript_69900:252-1343(-)